MELYKIKADNEVVAVDSNLVRFIEMIKIDELKEFTKQCLLEYGTESKLIEANNVADILVQLLRKKNLLTDQVHQSFVDVLLTSTLLHNLFYDNDDWTTLFKARKDLINIADRVGINQQVTDAIFQTIEAQLGESTPVPLCKPGVNSPTELFAYAVWFAKEYVPNMV